MNRLQEAKRVIELINEGYEPRLEDGCIVVENPDFEQDKGNDPYFVVEIATEAHHKALAAGQCGYWALEISDCPNEPSDFNLECPIAPALDDYCSRTHWSPASVVIVSQDPTQKPWKAKGWKEGQPDGENPEWTAADFARAKPADDIFVRVGPKPRRLVIIESPYAGDVEANVEYARACVRDSLERGEAPIASHLLYTQPGVLNDDVPSERRQGIDAGLAWRRVADASVVYTDRGVSSGMTYGIRAAKEAGRLVEYRSLKDKKQ